MLKVAIAKGRVAEQVKKKMNSASGYADLLDLKSRKLIFSDEKRSIEFILVKPSDLPVYVEKGAVDVGIVGKDVLLEHPYGIYEIMDLDICKCRMVVAGPPENKEKLPYIKRIATKYPRTAQLHMSKMKHNLEIVKLDGSIEIAPLVGLSEAIVDIVESGSTLKENGLIVYEDICEISTRMIANKISYKLKNHAISEFIKAFGEEGSDRDD